MKNRKNIISVAVVALSVSGCASDGSIDPLAATITCGLGGVAVGALTGSAWAGVGTAAGCGALTLAFNYYKATQVRSVAEDQKLYGYGLNKPITSTTVKIRNANATPSQIKRGQSVIANTEYSVMVPNQGQQVQVTEISTLKKDGKILLKSENAPAMREAGGWDMKIEIPIPDDAEPGTYVIEQRIEAGTTNDIREVPFVVSS